MPDLNILVVDDSLTMRSIITNALRKKGYNNIILAVDGNDALEKMYLEKINFIITDWMMPGMNGVEFVTTVKKDKFFKDIPILMVTSKNIKKDVVIALKAGCDNYIVKPITPDLLDTKIKEMLRSDIKSDFSIDDFYGLYEKADRLFPIKILEKIDTAKFPRASASDKVSLKIKSSGEIKEFELNVAAIVLRKGIAEEIPIKDELEVKESYEERRARLHNVAVNLYNKASTGDQQSLKLLVVMLANNGKIFSDKSTRICDIVSELLVEYKGSELPSLIVKMFAINFNEEPANTYEILQQKSTEALIEPFKLKALELLKLRIPAVFRREYVNAHQEKSKLGGQLYEATKQVFTMKRPSDTDSGYQTDSADLGAAEDKADSIKSDIPKFEKQLKMIDESVKKEIDLLQELGHTYSVSNIKKIIEIYNK